MSKQHEAKLVCSGKKFAVVASRFNDLVTKELISGCTDSLLRHGVKDNEIEIFWVPGAFEIPTLANVLAKKKKYDAVICLGAIIRGATPHFDFIAAEVSKGIAMTSMETGVPTIFGIITADTIEQAIERSGTKEGNKGRDAALSAIEMVNLLEQI
jgi:6,7-dimethyl-8-ribityllumazine synthase